jgi:hypothetical protein
VNACAGNHEFLKQRASGVFSSFSARRFLFPDLGDTPGDTPVLTNRDVMLQLAMRARNNEQAEKSVTRFFDALRDVFVGAKVEGESGYINQMRIKSRYYESGKW